MKFECVEGWTGDLDFYLRADGTTPSGTMSGMTVELILKDADGNQLETTGDVAVLSASAWTVRYSPDAADLPAGSYRARFKVTDSNGKVVFFPNKAWDDWKIRAVA